MSQSPQAAEGALARRLIVSIAGIGFLPRGQATAASLVAALAFLVFQPGLIAQIVLLGVAVVVGQMCSRGLVTPDRPDPDYIVIDEVAGVWLALLGTPLSAPVCAAGALIFRVIDRLKPGPVGLVDRAQANWSVMGDDLVAGLLTCLVLHAGLAVIGVFS